MLMRIKCQINVFCLTIVETVNVFWPPLEKNLIHTLMPIRFVLI